MQVAGVASAEQVTTLHMYFQLNKKSFAYLTVVLIPMMMYFKIRNNRNLTMAFCAKYQQNIGLIFPHFFALSV